MEAIEFDKRVCVCGNTRFYMMPKTFINGGTAVGLYCSDCGQWQKWMNKKTVVDLKLFVTRQKTI